MLATIGLINSPYQSIISPTSGTNLSLTARKSEQIPICKPIIYPLSSRNLIKPFSIPVIIPYLLTGLWFTLHTKLTVLGTPCLIIHSEENILIFCKIGNRLSNLLLEGIFTLNKSFMIVPGLVM